MSGTSLGGEHLMSYRHNGRGERVYRQGSDRTVHTVFDEADRWIGDYDENGAVIQQAIWLGDLPVGLLAKDGGITRLFHIEADALGSPRAVIDPTRGARGAVVWRWDLAGEAFGNDKPNEDPDGDGIAFVFDMRYPGQQYDSATGLNYNYFRDYDPSTGRYSQSDPIGLRGGISTYAYAHQNPYLWIDPKGLAVSTCANLNASGTIQCNGRGGYEIVACNTPCLNKCTIKHERQHVYDFARRYGANSCANRARGDIPSDATMAPNSLVGYSDFMKMTECRAYDESIKCADEIIDGGCNCKSEAAQYKQDAIILQERYRCSTFIYRIH